MVDVGLDAGPVNVDPCIADLVCALNRAGLHTVASCCGHGKIPGRISLRDGREIWVNFSPEETGELDNLITSDIHGDSKGVR